jgi:rRNA-processing protein FCF1
MDENARFLLDANIADLLTFDPMLPQILEKVEGMAVLMTHVQWDELTKIREERGDRKKILDTFRSIVTDFVPTSGVITGLSRCGAASIGNVDDYSYFLENKTRVGKHQKDTLIALTAKRENAVLITEDSKLYNNCTRTGIKVKDYQEFKNCLFQDK